MSEAMTQAMLWDRRIERAEWLLETAYNDLGHIIDEEKAMDFLMETRKAALEDATSSFERQTNDKVLTFSDGSKLLLIAADANTAAGDSRVLCPSDRTQTRRLVRGGGEYQHGTNQKAWLAFPPHDSF